MTVSRARLRKRGELEGDALHRRQTVWELCGRIGDCEQIAAVDTFVSRDPLEALMESACKLRSAGQAGGDADAGPGTDREPSRASVAKTTIVASTGVSRGCPMSTPPAIVCRAWSEE
jgi:hypothetical protein